MDTSRFDTITTMLAQTSSRRRTLRLFGAAALGAGGLSLLGSQAGEAKKRRKKNKKKKNQGGEDQQPTPQNPQTPQQPQPLSPDIAITAITVATTAVANHDDVVVAFSNIGTQSATFRIGMIAVRSSGQIRNEVFSLPVTLAPGASTTTSFQLGCSWLNNGTITARTDPNPVSGELNGNTANNTLSVTFGAAVCS
jgi:hypothetical protein